MKDIPDNYYDLAVVDPPYGIFGKNGNKTGSFAWKIGTGGGYAKKYSDKATKWDVAPDESYFNELKRISKEQIVWGANHFGFTSNNYLIWRKLTISESFSMGMVEFAHVSLKGNPKWVEIAPQGNKKNKRFHPTSKPVKLYEWQLTNYAKPGWKIFDSHFGSLSIGIACHNLGFDLDACEIDKDYFEAGKKRLEWHQKQLRLFV